MQSLARSCPVHPHKTICAICFHKGCTNPLICVTCAKAHPDEHEEAFNDLSTLQNNPQWVAAYEQIKYHLNNQKDAVLPQYKSMITAMVDKVIQALEDKKQSLLKDLTDLANAQDYNLFYLFDNFRIDRSISSESIDNCGDLVIPDEDDIAQKAEEAINNLKLDEIKINNFQNELNDIINGFNLNDFLTSTSTCLPKKRYRFDDYEELKKANEELYQDLQNQSEAEKSHIEKLQSMMTELNQENSKLIEENQVLSSQNTEYETLTKKVYSLTEQKKRLENEKNELTEKQQLLENHYRVFTLGIRRELEEFRSKDKYCCGIKKSLADGAFIYYCAGRHGDLGERDLNQRCHKIGLLSQKKGGLYLVEPCKEVKSTYNYSRLEWNL